MPCYQKKAMRPGEWQTRAYSATLNQHQKCLLNSDFLHVYMLKGRNRDGKTNTK